MNKILSYMPVWTQAVLVAFILSMMAWHWFSDESYVGSLVGYNHTDRPIYSFWVNENWGGNISANGGGSVTCCWDLSGTKAEVNWILSRTQKQAVNGVEEARIEIIKDMPQRNEEDTYLQVHFVSYEEVTLKWSSSSNSVLE